MGKEEAKIPEEQAAQTYAAIQLAKQQHRQHAGAAHHQEEGR